MNDERLRQRLLAGDPATEANGLTPGEIQAMRRAVLTATPEPRRRLLPVLALAGAAVTAALIAFFILRPGPVLPPAPPRVAAVPPRPVPPPRISPPPRTEAPARKKKEETRKRPTSRRRHLPAAPEETATLAALEPGVRQVQFSTPGGTRIIWMLTPGKTSR
jgi:hypothetical protein